MPHERDTQTISFSEATSGEWTFCVGNGPATPVARLQPKDIVARAVMGTSRPPRRIVFRGDPWDAGLPKLNWWTLWDRGINATAGEIMLVEETGSRDTTMPRDFRGSVVILAQANRAAAVEALRQDLNHKLQGVVKSVAVAVDIKAVPLGAIVVVDQPGAEADPAKVLRVAAERDCPLVVWLGNRPSTELPVAELVEVFLGYVASSTIACAWVSAFLAQLLSRAPDPVDGNLDVDFALLRSTLGYSGRAQPWSRAWCPISLSGASRLPEYWRTKVDRASSAMLTRQAFHALTAHPTRRVHVVLTPGELGAGLRHVVEHPYDPDEKEEFDVHAVELIEDGEPILGLGRHLGARGTDWEAVAAALAALRGRMHRWAWYPPYVLEESGKVTADPGDYERLEIEKLRVFLEQLKAIANDLARRTSRTTRGRTHVSRLLVHLGLVCDEAILQPFEELNDASFHVTVAPTVRASLEAALQEIKLFVKMYELRRIDDARWRALKTFQQALDLLAEENG